MSARLTYRWILFAVTVSLVATGSQTHRAPCDQEAIVTETVDLPLSAERLAELHIRHNLKVTPLFLYHHLTCFILNDCKACWIFGSANGSLGIICFTVLIIALRSCPALSLSLLLSMEPRAIALCIWDTSNVAVHRLPSGWIHYMSVHVRKRLGLDRYPKKKFFFVPFSIFFFLQVGLFKGNI